MGVVAGNTCQLTLALNVTPAGLHLLNMADRFGRLVLINVGPLNENGPDVRNRVARSEIIRLPTRSQYFELPLKMTLVANVIALDGPKLDRIDDRVHARTPSLTGIMKLDVVLARAVTTFAADASFGNDGFLVCGELHGTSNSSRGLSAMTTQTTVGDRSRKLGVIRRDEARGKVPLFVAGIPGERRHEEFPISFK